MLQKPKNTFKISLKKTSNVGLSQNNINYSNQNRNGNNREEAQKKCCPKSPIKERKGLKSQPKIKLETTI